MENKNHGTYLYAAISHNTCIWGGFMNQLTVDNQAI